MNTTCAVTLLTGLALGFTAGRRYQQAARGWADYRAAKAQVPVLLAAARSLTRNAALTVLLAALLAAFALHLVGNQ